VVKNNRVGKMLDSNLCFCHSGKLYKECCEPYHLGTKFPESSLLLMRSRYSGYALQLADYIMDTTHPKNSAYQKDRKKWAAEILLFCKKTVFRDLKIEDYGEIKKDWEFVTFTAYLEQEGQDVSFREKSLFERVEGKWLYLSAEIEKRK
jgi:SEC-C motif-containing protein